MKYLKPILENKWLLAGFITAVLAVIATVVISAVTVGQHSRYVLHDERSMQSHRAPVGLVLGAGITDDGKPFHELQSRLDVAADALQAGYVKKLIVSGDNRFHEYDEPTAMKRYLVEERGIEPASIQEDFAGRSTYESCERAAKVFQLDRTVIYSADSHLPRAIYLCRHFGVEAYGVASAVEANNATRREAAARVKALFNVYINGENTILGSPISVH